MPRRPFGRGGERTAAVRQRRHAADRLCNPIPATYDRSKTCKDGEPGMETLQNMALFVRVAQTGSFSAAGRAVGLSAASISRHINAIEQALGVRLIERTSRRHALTEAGHLYLEKAARICDLANELADQVSELQTRPRGLLHVQTRVAVGATYLAPVIPAFLTRYPDITLKMSLNEDNRDLIENKIDVGIRLGNLDEPLLMCRKISAGGERILFASPAYLSRRPEIRQPEDLRHHNCLTWPLDGRFEQGEACWQFRNASGTRELRVSGNLQVNNTAALHQAALAGVGIALQPIWCVEDDIACGRLVRILPEFEVTPTTFDHHIYAVYRKAPYLPPKIRVFIDFLANAFRRTSCRVARSAARQSPEMLRPLAAAS